MGLLPTWSEVPAVRVPTFKKIPQEVGKVLWWSLARPGAQKIQDFLTFRGIGLKT